jgi:hypothetical protein
VQDALTSQPLTKPGLVGTFVCNCQDCRKVTASAFATNFTTLQSHTKFARGEDNLTEFGQNETPVTGGYMTNGFCKTCGTLMYRQGSSFPGTFFLRVGTVDDHRLHDTVLRPEVEYFTKDRVEWLSDIPKAKQVEAFSDDSEKSKK